MVDWRSHIDGEPGIATEPRLKASGVEVEKVLSLLRDGWTLERLSARFPGLSDEDIRACFDYAVALVERAKMMAEVRTRLEKSEADPDRDIDHDEVMRELAEGEDSDE